MQQIIKLLPFNHPTIEELQTFILNLFPHLFDHVKDNHSALNMEFCYNPGDLLIFQIF